MKTKILNVSPEKWLTTTTYYDDRCRVIQTVSDNVEGFTSRVDMKYDFVGNVVQQRECHQVNASQTDVLESENAYDDRGRLLSSTTRLNSGAPATVSYSYDAVGRLVSKTRGSMTETITYNTRGWLTGKDCPAFKMKLRYEEPSGGVDTCWNGNISEWEWQHGTGVALMYGFSYDGVNRLKETVQKRKDGTTWSTLAGSYLEKGITYDRNGNIKTMQRTANGTTVDDLVYTYAGNQLTVLNENIRTATTGDVYAPGTVLTGTYAYDKSGNMITDSRKVLNIDYNVLNLLSEVKTGSSVKAKYSYLADGTKLRVRDNGDANGFNYLGSLTYRKSGAALQLESASFGEGMIRVTGSNSDPCEVDYFLRDHLGSVRVIVDGNGVVRERNDYYPFGARHVRGDYPQRDGNRYKYNGKEEQVTGDLKYLDYGARMYDSGLGRWFTVDPFSEKYVGITPYFYCLGNPVNAIDPDGRLVIFINGMHFGDGGKPDYWRTNIPYRDASLGRVLTATYLFDVAVMERLDDFKPIYKDGSAGGFLNYTHNGSSRYRIKVGFDQGIRDAQMIINKLSRDKNGCINESIKVITHSMGGAFGIGYVSAILEYARVNNIAGVVFDFVANFAPYQPDELYSIYGIDFFQFSHNRDGIAGNARMPGAHLMDTSGDERQDHSIFDFWNQIMNLPAGSYTIENGKIIPK